MLPIVLHQKHKADTPYTYSWVIDRNNQIINGPIMVIAKMLKMVVSSAAEAEVASLFHVTQTIVPLQITADELGHKQPATPLRADNNTTSGIMNDTIRQQQSKAMDMRFYWLKDRVTQQMFKVYWAPGKVNLADYFSKYHPASHFKKVRKLYVNEPDSPRTISTCNKILAQ